jgi:hypothetical protein
MTVYYRRLTALLLIFIILLGATFRLSWANRPGNPNGSDQFTYIPLVEKVLSPTATPSPTPSPGRIYGTVTHGLDYAPNVVLDLRFYDGATWSTIATTTTDNQGYYAFINMPSLNAGQRYYVRYLNTTNYAFLFTWHTLPITSYTAGQQVAGGDFSITNIHLYDPYPGAWITFPYTFRWQLRNTYTTDSYELNLFDYEDGDPYFYTPPLGFVETYTLNSRPDGFGDNIPYAWDMWVYGPGGSAEGNFGISFYANIIYFYSTNSGDEPTGVAVEQIKSADLPWATLERNNIPLDIGE